MKAALKFTNEINKAGKIKTNFPAMKGFETLVAFDLR